jgi:hypothetical protein
VTYSTLICDDSVSAACSSSADLPMPGSPPISTTPASTMPPPNTRSNSGWPAGVRSTSAASISDSVATACVLAKNWQRCLAAPLGSAMVSSSVFHALQFGHLPSHLGLAPPQALQTYWVLVRGFTGATVAAAKTQEGHVG